jgi:hypothetical protein
MHLRSRAACVALLTLRTLYYSHAEALAAWVEAATDARRPSEPYAVLHVDRHSDMNTPSSVFTSVPVGLHEVDADIEAEQTRLAPLRAAAIHEADLASFQMAGVWAGVVSSIAWVFGNSSEPFLLTSTGELEASCAGFACPLREWLQSDRATGYFTVNPRRSTASDVDAQQTAWQSGGGGLGGFDPQATSHLSSNQAPLTPSAPFDFWIGHIDQPTTISNAYLALSNPLDVGELDQQRRSQVAWVLDIDLDAFMPARFSHRVRDPPCCCLTDLARIHKRRGAMGARSID